MSERIGFIGLGRMGGPMSRRLLQAGYDLVAFDVDQQALERAQDLGAQAAGSPQEVARQCRTVITIVPNSNIVEQVVLGAEGLLQGAQEGDVLMEMTTAYPMSTLKVAERLRQRGVNMIDAPVSGGVVGAEAGTLSIMVGGEAQLVERVRPLLEAMGKNIFHMGPVGAGHAMKAVNNVLSACSMAATSEAVALAVKVGLDAKKVVDVLQVSTGRSYATEWKFPRFVLPRRFDDGFTIELFNKDLDICTRMARELGVPMFMAHTVQQLFSFAQAKGMGPEGHTAIAKLIEEWAGVTIAAPEQP
ncbi:MAG: NAD(P)-dependent oxidoreductase [Thermodesulfobacteriota bacterium]